MTAPEVAALQVRVVADGEWRECIDMLGRTFGQSGTEDDVRYWRDWADEGAALVASEAGSIVASCASKELELSVPGGTCRMAAMGFGQVLPTHTRRGILRRLLAQLHERARDVGAAVAGGWPSEGGIYGRFGWAPATYGTTWELTTARSAFTDVSRRGTEVQFVEDDDLGAALPTVYDACLAATPGMTGRGPEDWDHWRRRDPWDCQGLVARNDLGPRTTALVPGRGYVVYRVQRQWRDGVPQHRLIVAELVATDADAYFALVEFVAGIDLVTTVVATQRPVDEVLPLLLLDPRALQTTCRDALWLRVLDVKRCLAARRYGTSGALAVGVVDTWGSWAAGTYRLVAEEGGAHCASTRDTPDVVLTVQALSAACLGGTSLERLARAGVVTEHRPGALSLLTTMFASQPEPWCAAVF